MLLSNVTVLIAACVSDSCCHNWNWILLQLRHTEMMFAQMKLNVHQFILCSESHAVVHCEWHDTTKMLKMISWISHQNLNLVQMCFVASVGVLLQQSAFGLCGPTKWWGNVCFDLFQQRQVVNKTWIVKGLCSEAMLLASTRRSTSNDVPGHVISCQVSSGQEKCNGWVKQSKQQIETKGKLCKNNLSARKKTLVVSAVCQAPCNLTSHKDRSSHVFVGSNFTTTENVWSCCVFSNNKHDNTCMCFLC